MKKFLYSLIAFLIIGSAAGGAVLFSNLSYSDNRGGDLTLPQNSITASAPENTDLWTDGHYADAFAGGSGASNDPYQIATAEQLARLAYLINDSTTNADYNTRYYVQTANIDLSLYYWDAIGAYTSSSGYLAFAGHYNGGGFVISGMYTQSGSTSDFSRQGLFGYVYGTSDDARAEIHDLGVIASSVQGYQYIGAIAGYAYYCNITSCYNTSEVIGVDQRVGGIVGFATYCNITKCYNTGEISSTNSYAGGVAGGLGHANVGNCYNTGSVSGSATIGGISGSTTNRSSIYNCYNAGTINCIGGTGSRSVGGISGSIYDYASFYNCFNVTSSGISAGICYSTSGLYLPSIYKCYSTYVSSLRCDKDVIRDTQLTTHAKDIDWYLDSSNWTSSYLWDFENTWIIYDAGVNEGYPVLQSGGAIFVTYNSNFGENEVDTKQIPEGEDIVIEDLDLFTRPNYTLTHWNTRSDNSGTTFHAGDIYTGGAALTLYAIWEPLVYTITLDWNGGVDNQSALGAMYIKYDTGIYSNSTTTASLRSLSESNLPTRAGFTLLGFYTENNTSSICLISVTADSTGERTGTFSELLTTTYFIDHATLYAQWSANNPAYYDADGDYWYVENGRMPQSRVSSSLNRTLDRQWASLNDGATYSMGAFGGLVLTTKVYQNEEYYYNETLDDYYLVEPIKWRLTSNAGQTSGYGTTEDTYAVMDTIVYYGQYSTGAINSGDGYQITPVYYLKDNYLDSTFLVRETKSMPTFGGSGSLNSTSQTFTDNIFVSSREDIIAVADTYSVKFSDLVTDLLADAGSVPLYYTRDLGTNLNHVYCLTPDGALLQYQPNRNKLGVQFTIKITEYACVG